MLDTSQLSGFGSRAGGAAAFSVTNSGDFERSEGDFLSITGQSGNVDKWTCAMWLQRESLGGGSQHHTFLGSTTAGENFARFLADDSFKFNNTGSNYRIETTATYTDTSNFHHWVIHYDSGNATGGDRMRVWYDGTEVTAFDIDSNPTQNLDSIILSGSVNTIGRSDPTNTHYYDGLVAEFYLISDQLLDPTYFIDGTPGNAIAFGGSYGADDSYLNFSNSGDLGEDSSGNGNDWTNTGVSQSATVPPF
tara:strand:+ start:47 stop:793 length:747 start_codon:yes stop_codon:yes gene_type:complete